MKLLSLSFIFISTIGWAQTDAIDSLQQILTNTKGEIRAKILTDLCWEYRLVDADKGRAYGLEALAIARENKLEKLEAESLHNIAVNLESQGNYREALDYELQAIVLWKKDENKNEISIASTYNNLGIIYDETGNPKRKHHPTVVRNFISRIAI